MDTLATRGVTWLVGELSSRFLKDHVEPLLPAIVHRELLGGTWIQFTLYELLGYLGREKLTEDGDTYFAVLAATEDRINIAFERRWAMLRLPEVRGMERAKQQAQLDKQNAMGM